MYFWKVAYFTTLCLCEHHSVIFVSEWKNQVLEGSGLRSTNGLSIVKLKRRKSSLFNFVSTHGRNHVNETARHGIVAHCLWEENLGNITKVFVNDSFRIIAQTLRFCCQNTISERNDFELLFSLLGYSSGNETKDFGQWTRRNC